MVEKLVEVGILFDFYGKLLSERQYRIIDLFYNEDFSLSEIAEELDITRQGVYDASKRAEEKLYQYEKTLGLAGKFKEGQENTKKILQFVKDIKKDFEQGNYNQIIVSADLIEDISLEILKDSWEVMD